MENKAKKKAGNKSGSRFGSRDSLSEYILDDKQDDNHRKDDVHPIRRRALGMLPAFGSRSIISRLRTVVITPCSRVYTTDDGSPCPPNDTEKHVNHENGKD